MSTQVSKPGKPAWVVIAIEVFAFAWIGEWGHSSERDPIQHGVNALRAVNQRIQRTYEKS